MSGLADPRGREVDEHAWKAEQLRRAGDFEGAQRHFELAAIIEQEIAEAASTGPIRVKSVLAVSAVALWYKAGEWSNAERLAHRWLGEERLSDEARDELIDLLQRCWVESQFDAQALRVTLPIELRLVGGEIKRGLAPARLVRTKQRVLVETLERIAEWQLGHDYRESGSSKLAGDLEILQAPARAASYGLRLYLRSTIQTVDVQLSTQVLLSHFFNFASGDVDALEQVSNLRYRQRFTENLRKLCADGKHVADIIYSSPTWRIQMPEVHLDRAVRNRLASQEPLPSTEVADLLVVGTLNTIRLTTEERFIEVATPSGAQTRVHLPKQFSSETLAHLLDKPVQASTRREGRDLVLDGIEASGS